MGDAEYLECFAHVESIPLSCFLISSSKIIGGALTAPFEKQFWFFSKILEIFIYIYKVLSPKNYTYVSNPEGR